MEGEKGRNVRMPRYSMQDSRDDDRPRGRITSQQLREAADLFAYLRPYRLKLLAAFAALLSSSLLALALPYVTGNLVDGALRAAGGGASDSSSVSVNHIALLLVGVLAAQATVMFFQTLWFNEVGERTLADLRKAAYARLICLPMRFFSQRRVGELTGRITGDLAQIQDTLIYTVPHALRQLALLLGGIGLILVTSPQLTLVMLTSMPILIGLAAVFGRFIRRFSRDAQDRLAESNVILEETLQNIASVKAFNNERYELGRYRSGLDRFLEVVLRGAKFRGAFIAFIVFALFGGIVLVLWYGALLVQQAELSAGELTRFLLYTMFVAGALGTFAELYSQLQRALGATQRVRELLHETPEPVDLPIEKILRPKPRGWLSFEEVTFAYPSRPEVQVVKKLSLEAKPGQRIALVGPSGAGKSTLMSLLLRFYEPDSGRITLDGRNLNDYSLPELRALLALVPQDVILFGGTLAENIAYGKPGAGDEEIIEAARKAHAHDFIDGFPEGYETRVGDRGVQLSGGQRQRVAIARAILKNPAILLLDEATSSLDSESESHVQLALEELMEGRTSLIIAHRLATVRKADRIFVIRDGAAVESGKHEELIQRADGLYRALSELQFDMH